MRLIDDFGNTIFTDVELAETGWTRCIELQATADRRKELLRRVVEQLDNCPLCNAEAEAWTIYIEGKTGVEVRKYLTHADDCELEKELCERCKNET